MKLVIIPKGNNELVVLLDDKMQLVKPVCDYIKFLQTKGRAMNTVRLAGRCLKTYWDFLNIKCLLYNRVTPNDIGSFIEFLREYSHDGVSYINVPSKLSGKTINNILSHVYGFYKYCAKVSDITSPIPMEDVNRPLDMFKGLLHHVARNNKIKKSVFKVKETKKEIKVMNHDKAEEFLKALPTWRDKIIFKLMYLCGMRIGEVLSLNIEDVPVPDSTEQVGIITLQYREENRYDQQTKTGGRAIYAPMDFIEEIDRFIMEDRNKIDTDHSYIFISNEKQYLGKPLTYRGLYEVYQNVSKKTGIPFNFHILRHSYVTALIESGIDVSVVKILVGHKHISTTQQYTHLTNRYIGNVLVSYWQKNTLLGGVLNDK